jgi:hypothetical protein
MVLLGLIAGCAETPRALPVVNHDPVSPPAPAKPAPIAIKVAIAVPAATARPSAVVKDGQGFATAFDSVDRLAALGVERIAEHLRPLRTEGFTPLLVPAASECLPEPVARSVSVALGRRLGPMVAPHDAMLRQVIGEQGRLQLVDFEPTARARLAPANLVVTTEWLPRPDNRWGFARLRLALIGLRDDGPVRAGRVIFSADYLVHSDAPCRRSGDYEVTVGSCRCADDQASPFDRRKNAMTCAAIDARMRLARRVGQWLMQCQTRRNNHRLDDELCVERIAGRTPRLIETASDYRPESCVARIEFKAESAAVDRPATVLWERTVMDQNRRDQISW